MRYLWLFVCAVFAVALNQPALAAEELKYGPAPAWVQPIEVPAGKKSDEDAATRALLDETQVYFAPDGDYYYYQTANQVLTADGLDELGLFTQSWDPLLDTLTIHAVEIIRDGTVIDVLKEGEPFSVIRREKNLNYAMLDGRLTATKQLEDLRIGDVVRVSMTIFSKDPSLADHNELWDTLSHDGVIGRVRYRYIWPKDQPLRWRVTKGFNPVVESQTALGTELVADATDVRMPLVPSDAPDRFNTLGEIEITSFDSWQELSALFAPYYTKAAILEADSPIRAEAAKIREAHSGKVAQASAALALVEQRVRYVALTMGQAGYQPAQADLTWTRRFGDCKGKSALLIALLAELGIAAEPAIVRTEYNDGIETRFPRAGLFDHVIVRAEIDGKVYWMDPTRTGDTNIQRLSVPPYLWALPLRAGGAGLEQLVMPRPAEPLYEVRFELDQTGGLDADTRLVRTEIYRGEQAYAAWRQQASQSRAEAEREFRKSWAEDMAWFEITKLELGTEIAPDGSFTHVITGKTKTPWSNPAAGRQRTVSFGDSSFETSFEKREADRFPTDAPYSLKFPFFSRWTMIMKLPRQGEGFEMVGADVDETVGGMVLRRKSRLEEGVFTTTLDLESLSSEVAYADAAKAGAIFKRLPTASDMVVRAPRNFASTGKEVEALTEERPSDAQAFVLSAQHNLQTYRPTAALADANQALALEAENMAAVRLKSLALASIGDLDGGLKVLTDLSANEEEAPVAFLLRSALYSTYDRHAEALADADKAVQMLPNYTGALTQRAELHRDMGNNALALADIDAALKISPDDRQLHRLRMWHASSKNAPLQPSRDQLIDYVGGLIVSDRDNAELYSERAELLRGSRLYDLARKDYDKAISIDPSASHYGLRAEFLAGRQQDRAALSDYDRAIKLDPTAPRYAARAGYFLSIRDHARARQDIEAAMKLDPEDPALVASLAILEIEASDPAAAFSRVEALSKVDPASFELAQLKASIHAAGKAYDLALADIAALEARKGNTPDQVRSLQLMRAEVLSDKGQHAAAVDILDQLVAKEPQEPSLLNMRCWTRATGKIELVQAKADCDAALAMTSATDAEAYLDSLGLVYLQLGRNEDAVKVYDRVLEMDGRYPTSLHGRGLARARLGDARGAKADMTAAARLDPEVGTEFLGYQLAQ